MTPAGARARGLAMAGVGMLLMGPDSVLLRSIEAAGTAEILFYRTLFIGVALAAVLCIARPERIVAALAGLGSVGWAATLVLVGNQIGFVVAISQTTVTDTLAVLASIPLFAAFLGWLVLGEAVPPRTWAAIVTATGGVLLILGGSVGSGTLSGALAALATAFLCAVYLVILRRATTELMLVTLCLSGLITAALVLPFADPFAVSARDLSILAFLGLVLLPVAFTLFFGGATLVPAGEIGLMALLETVLGPIWCWLLIGEVPTPVSLAGAALVVVAILAHALAMIREERAGTAAAVEPST